MIEHARFKEQSPISAFNPKAFRNLPSEVMAATEAQDVIKEPRPKSSHLKGVALLVLYVCAVTLAMVGWIWFLGWAGMHFLEWLYG